MKCKYWLIGIVVAASLLGACAMTPTKPVLSGDDSVKAAVNRTFNKSYTVYILKFANLSGDKDLVYLDTAIPQGIATALMPMEREKATVRSLDIYLPGIEGVGKAIEASINNYSNFITNIRTFSTQFITLIETNTNIADLRVISNRETRTVKATNKYFMTTNAFLALISANFPEQTQQLTQIPIRLWKLNTNIADIHGLTAKSNAYCCYIGGEYRVLGGAANSKDIEIVVKAIRVTESIEEMQEKILCKESEVLDKLQTTLKSIRQWIHRKPSGDLAVVSVPEGANLYLDGTFLGRTPILYPAVPEGIHQITIQTPEYEDIAMNLQLIAGKTNLIRYELKPLQRGGMVKVTTTPTNLAVFLDSVLVGRTPLKISNITLNVQHKLKIQDLANERAQAVYYDFKMKNASEIVNVQTALQDYGTANKTRREVAWWSAIGGWGLLVGMIGMNVYTDYQMQYYQDLYGATANTSYSSMATWYSSLNQTSFTVAVGAGILASMLTANALAVEQFPLGIDVTSQDEVKATFSVSF